MKPIRSPLVPLTVIAAIVAGAFVVLLLTQAITGNSSPYVPKWGSIARHHVVTQGSPLESRGSIDGPARPDIAPAQTATPLVQRIDTAILNSELPRETLTTSVNVLFLILACVLAVRSFLPERRYFYPALLATAVVSALSYPVLCLIERGSIDGVTAFLLAVVLHLWCGGWSALAAGAALALAAAFWWPLLLLLAPALVQRRWRVLAGALLGAALLYFPFAAEWNEHIASSAARFWRPHSNASVPAFLFHLGELHGFTVFEPLQFHTALALSSAAVHAFVLLLLERSTCTRHSALPSAWIPLALAFPLLVDPSMHVLLIPVIPFLAAAYLGASRGWMRIGIILAAAGLALTLIQSFALSFVFDADGFRWLGAPGILLLGAGLLLYRIEAAYADCFSAQPLHVSSQSAGRAGSPLHIRAIARLRQLIAHVSRLCQAAAKQRKTFGVLAALLFAGLMLWYGFYGFHLLQLSVMFGAVLSAAFSFGTHTRVRAARFAHRWADVRAAVLLALLVSPFYLAGVYWVPIQINTDELSIMRCAINLNEQRPLDLFALEHAYFGFPAGCFSIVGFEAALLGGVTLETMRIVNGFHGVLIVVSGFVLFLQFWPRRIAIAAALLLAFSHTLVGISRMGARDNLPLLLELLALITLVHGWRTRRHAWLVIGGAVAGLGVYNYFPARIIFIVWTAFVATLLLRERFSPPRTFWSASLSRAMSLWLPALAGFVLVAGPMFINTWRMPEGGKEYARQQLIIYPQGREFLRNWEEAPTTWEAFKSNAFYGLGAFNNNVKDRSHFYSNPGNGFVDPITGVLFWIGLWRVFRLRRRRAQHWFMASSLLCIWLPLSLLMTKNPAYPRMLPLLPFAIMLAVEGARAASFAIAKLRRDDLRLRRRLLRVAIAAIVLANLRIYHEHYEHGLKGDVAGNTIRYVDAKLADKDRAFYICVGEQHNWYWWGREGWLEWIQTSARPPRTVALLKTEDILSGQQPKDLKLPASIFLSRELWEHTSEKLLAWYPDAKIRRIVPSGAQLVLEVPRPAR